MNKQPTSLLVLLTLTSAAIALNLPQQQHHTAMLVQGTLSSHRDEFALSNTIKEHSLELSQMVQQLVPEIEQAAEVMTMGICKFKGFCKSNPARSCVEILEQDGIANQTDLADGKYWLQLEQVLQDGSVMTNSTPVWVDCLMGGPYGAGWVLLFDESGKELISQEFNPDVANVRFKETLVFTPAALNSTEPLGRQTYFFNVDETHLTHPTSLGFTPNQAVSGTWVGQDGYGKTVRGNIYPQYANHFRFKYLGKPGPTATSTLFVLDDGAIGPSRCRHEELRGLCFNDADDAAIAQVCSNPRGLISFGCYDDQKIFTQCGTCVYAGYGDKETVIRNSVIQKMYVR